MRLADLDPRWLGNRQGILFRCPTNRDNWLTVFFTPMPRKEQYKLWGAARPGSLDEDGYPNDTNVVFCKPEMGWRIVCGSTFEDISIMPSLDASASGNWHGHITNGEIVGGI